MISTNAFCTPEKHPYGMLKEYENAHEKENLLAMVLKCCIEAGAWIPVKTKYQHPSIVADGLLSETPEGYVLTTKAKGLLYTVYGKNE